MIFISYDAIEMDMMLPHVSYLGIELSGKEMKENVNLMTKGREKHVSSLIMLWYITTLE